MKTMQDILLLFVCYLGAAVTSPTISPDFIPPSQSLDYARIDGIRQACAAQQNISSYDIYKYTEQVGVNDSVKCAFECEMKARNHINEDGKLNMEILGDEYRKEKFAFANNFFQNSANYVLDVCPKKWEEENSDSCDKAFQFQKCLVVEQAYFYERNAVKNCLYQLQGIDDNDTQDPRYHVPNTTCIMSDNCYRDIQRYTERNGVNSLRSVAEETGFLHNHPKEKDTFFNNTENCYEIKKSGGFDDCNKDLVLYTCLVAEFKPIFRYLRKSGE